MAVATALLSALVLFGSAGVSTWDWIRETLDWRDQAYNQLASLHAGYTRAKFQSELGEPVFDRMAENGRFREQTFRRREHWVQTVSGRDGSVVLYAVTACGPKFRPTFDIPGGPRGSRTVTLNVSRFSEVSNEGHTHLNYFGSGATANSRFHDVAPGINSSNYKWFVWGINDVCPDWFETVYPRVNEAADIPSILDYAGLLADAPAWARRIRRNVRVNTYAETAPHVDVATVLHAFQVGPDRILTRTTGD